MREYLFGVIFLVPRGQGAAKLNISGFRFVSSNTRVMSQSDRVTAGAKLPWNGHFIVRCCPPGGDI